MANTEQALSFARDLEVAALKGVAPPQNWTSEAVRHIKALTAASAEAATPVAWMWRVNGWAVTAHGKHPAVKTYVDTCQPPISTQESPEFIEIVPLVPQASQPIGQPESLGEWVDVTKRLPERGQRIQGLSRSGAWIETFDPDEQIGHMTHWRAVDDDATDATEQPDGASQCKHAYTGNAGDGYTCMFCMKPKDSLLVEIDSQPVSDAMTDELIEKYTLDAGECPSASKVMLVSVIRRLLSASGQAGQSDIRAIAMRVAEAAYKEGSGRDRAVASDKLRFLVDEVLGTPAQPTEAQQSEKDAPNFKQFAADVLDQSRKFGGADVDGSEIQELAAKYGLLVERNVTEPCGESCECADLGFIPGKCFFYAPEVLNAIAQEKSK